MELSLLDIFRIGRSAVQLFPATSPPKPCLQPQAFRVLQKQLGSEVGTENLGAVPTDKDSPFFWSKKWHNLKYNPNKLSYDYPIVTMFEIINETEDTTPFQKGFKRCHTIEISALDVYKEDCTKGNKIGCDARPINQIYIDTGIILDSVLRFYGQTVIATTNVDPTEKVYFKPWLEAKKLAGDIAAFNVVKDLAVMLQPNNKKMRFARVEKPARFIFGTKTQFTFCTTNCQTIVYNTDLPDFGLLSFEAGCTTC